MKKTRRLRMKLCIIQMLLILVISGCNDTPQEEIQVHETPIEVQAVPENSQTDAEEIIDICIELYEKTSEENKIADLEMIRSIVNHLGEKGYPAVDSKNQINMTETNQVVEFCKMVDAQKEAEISIVEVNYTEGFTKYDLKTKDGNVDVVKSCYEYEDGKMERTFIGSYTAENWSYTEEGYLMFSGVMYSEEQYVLTMSGAEEHTALRVQPLDETYRELNRTYLLPIGYAQNNMFLVDWSEDDFGELNFYDMYDILYYQIYGDYAPYEADDNLDVGAIYRIPKDEFESVIMTYFNIDSEALQSKTTYYSEDATYEYKPRGFYESEYPEYPYSEVVGFTENTDGTITLIANVVFPYGGDSKVYAHELVVRPLEAGGVQYVSNHIIPSADNSEGTWHRPRMTEEEWEKMYGVTEEDTDTEASTESLYWFIPQADNCLIAEEEIVHLQSLVLSAIDLVREHYKDNIIVDAPKYSSGIDGFTDEQRKAVVEQLGENGLVSIGEDVAMQNHEEIERFYSNYLAGQESMITIYEVRKDGLIGVVTFIYRKGELQTYYVGVRWGNGGVPEIQSTLVSDVAEIKLTEKGYFIYAFEEIIAHASLRQYWRIEPLPEECRELTEKYISGLSYVNYNVLVTNWDSSNVEDILMPCMYQDIYRIHTGKNLKTEGWKIPAEEYEEIMTTYFPVSVEQLREHCGYDEDNNCYEHEMIRASAYPPFGEVVDYTENGDGTITLIVDGVWTDYNSDFAFRNKIVVQPFDDGTFRYLSNSIEEMELELPPIARRKG